MALLLGLDVGTSSVKAVLVDDQDVTVTAASWPVALATPAPGRAEADPVEWLDAAAAALGEACSVGGRSPRDVTAVAVTGMTPATVLTDARGRPVGPAVLQSDARATREVAEVVAVLGDDALTETGSAVSQQWVGPSYAWLARHDGEAVGRARSLMGSYDYVARALGAGAHVEQNWALESGLFRLDGTAYAESRRASGVPDEILAPVLAPGEVAGTVSAAGAAWSGLAEGTAIVVGGADHIAATFAAGCLEPGEWLVKLGSAGDVMAVTDHPVIDRRLYLDRHQVPGRWIPNGCMASTGATLAWLRELAGGVDVTTIEAAAAASRPGSLMCLPYFLGEKSPLHDPGMRGAVLGLHLGTTAGDLYRAALEGTAYAYRRHIELMAGAGITLTDGRITNGGSRSALWRQVVADVLDRPLVSLVHGQGAGVGAAVTAAVGLGQATWEDILRLVQVDSVVEPAADRTVHDERYAQFLELTDILAGPLHALARTQDDDERRSGA